MGWSYCGKDRRGRDIGYGVLAFCDEPGCNTEIDRGLAYACGGMHGEIGGLACEGYFCGQHLFHVFVEDESEELHGAVCSRCRDFLETIYCTECGKHFGPEEEAKEVVERCCSNVGCDVFMVPLYDL